MKIIDPSESINLTRRILAFCWAGLVAALLFASLACAPSEQAAGTTEITATADHQATIEAGVAATIQAMESLTESAPSPTVITARQISQPTAAPRPTATRQPMATPRPTATRRPTATPELMGSEQFTVPAGDIHTYEIQSPGDGYINYQFTSVKDGNTSEFLDIDFELSVGSWVWFKGDDLTKFIASSRVKSGVRYTFQFDNTSSIFAGKVVYLKFRWSTQPLDNFPVIPYWGQHENTDRCQQAKQAQASGDAALFGAALSIGVAAFTGDWFSSLGSLLSLFLSSDQTDPASKAIVMWGCGIE